MRKRLKLLLVACAAVVGLAATASALAAYKPVFLLNEASYSPGAQTSVELFIDIPAEHDATARVLLASPQGYSANLTAAPGTRIGTILEARVNARQLGGVLRGTGTVVVGNQTDPAIATASTRCTGTPTHGSVWVLNITISGQTLAVPMFVDSSATGVRITVCLPSPFIPENQGGARFGAQLLTADVILNNAITNPGDAGVFAWSGIFTPWVTGTGNLNVAGTVEARALLPHPYAIRIKVLKRKGNKLTIQGKVTSALPLAGERLFIYAGPSPSKLNPKPVGRTSKVKANGTFTFTRTAGKKVSYVEVDFGPADVTNGGCAGTSPAPGGCVSASLAFTFSNDLKLPKAKKKRKHR